MTDTSAIVHLESSRFGELQIPENKLINCPEGIIGFPETTRYALLDPSGGQSLFLWLQAVDNPDLAFIIANPLAILPDYSIDNSEPDLERLDINEKSFPALFVIVTVPPNDPDNVNANLLAPLLYFESDNTLFQIVLEKGGWSLKHPLIESSESESLDTQDASDQTGEVQ